MPDLNPDYVGAGILIFVVILASGLLSKFLWKIKFYSAVGFSWVLAWGQLRGAILKLASLPINVKPDLLNDPNNAWIAAFLNNSWVYFSTAVLTAVTLFWFLWDIARFFNRLNQRFDVGQTKNYKGFTNYVIDNFPNPDMKKEEVVNEEMTITSRRLDADHIQTTVTRKTETITQLKEKDNGSNHERDSNPTVGSPSPAPDGDNS